MLAIEHHGLILDAAQQPPEGRIAYFTSLCVLRSGTILCGCQNGPGKHAPTSTIRLSRSRDDGRSWELLPVRFETHLGGDPGSPVKSAATVINDVASIQRAAGKLM